MHVNWQAIGGILLAVWLFIKNWYKNFSSVITPVVGEVEKLAQDGKIDKADRKAIALKTMEVLQAQGKVKINFIEKMILGKLIDLAAEKLPDFAVSKSVTDTVKTVIGFMDEQTKT